MYIIAYIFRFVSIPYSIVYILACRTSEPMRLTKIREGFAFQSGWFSLSCDGAFSALLRPSNRKQVRNKTVAIKSTFNNVPRLP